jgi:CBS-domain-containing membrane protein
LKRDARLHVLRPEQIPGIAARLRLTWLLKRFPQRPLWAVFMFVNGFVTIALLAALAMISHTPFVFPSLGPTAILLFLTPLSPTASPRNTMYGHAIGILCGYASLRITGLEQAPAALIAGVDHRRILAAALSLALTSGLLVLMKSAHPPAGATTLIISLGFVTRPAYLIVLEIAVGLLVLQGIFINRAAGLDYPLWAKHAGGDVP